MMSWQSKDDGPLVILRGRRTQVRLELERLIREWLETVKDLLGSSHYNSQTTTIAIKNSFANISLHECLREKILVFLLNTFTGFGFLLDKWISHPHEENAYSWLAQRIPPWINHIEMQIGDILQKSYWTAHN